ncbi:hypothetical protein [Nocardia sp. NPDC050175]|uniref:hypothetical protein n=1 Tax=Nocardia sp. NPDC050175 TaxID=3364317 RepID=UPI003792E2D3
MWLPSAAARILWRLSAPARPDRVAAELDLDPALLADRLGRLHDRQVLFEEGGRVMSLVTIDEAAFDEPAPAH